jgi:hypothetical protein
MAREREEAIAATRGQGPGEGMEIEDHGWGTIGELGVYLVEYLYTVASRSLYIRAMQPMSSLIYVTSSSFIREWHLPCRTTKASDHYDNDDVSMH